MTCLKDKNLILVISIHQLLYHTSIRRNISCVVILSAASVGTGCGSMGEGRA